MAGVGGGQEAMEGVGGNKYLQDAMGRGGRGGGGANRKVAMGGTTHLLVYQ